jgi:ribosomal protein S18 acetylase RimI-like enzyme
MEASLRLATPADALSAAHLLYDFNSEYNEPSPEPPALAHRLRELLADGDTLIALAGDPVAGIAVVRLRRSLWTPGQEAYLAELYVRPDQRGRGTGRRLLLYAMEQAKQRGADYIDLNTAEDDTVARHLYESLGFSRTEGDPDKPVNYYYEREL